MEIKKKELLKALTQIKPGIAKNDLLEQSTDFIFNKTNIYTCNDRIAVSKNIHTNIQGAVSSKELHALLNKLKEDTITIEEKDDELYITVNKLQAGIKLNKEIIVELPIKNIKETKWSELPDNFTEAIKFASFVASIDYSLNIPFYCVSISNNNVIACDNYKGCVYTFSSPINDSFLLPIDTVKELIKYKATHYCVIDEWIHFKNKDSVMFSSRIHIDNYPDINDFFNIEGINIKLPSELNEIINKTEIFAKDTFDQDSYITILLENNKLSCKGEGEQGWATEEADIKYKKQRMEFMVNPALLKDILSYTNKVKLNENGLLFKTKDFQYVVSLFTDN